MGRRGLGTDARTHRSDPASFEMYAIHRPSGENIGATSCAGVLRNTVGVPGVQPRAASPSIGRIIRSQLVAPRLAWKARNLPLGCHDQGRWSSGLSVSRVTSPVPSAFTQYRLKMPALARSDANTMRRPSGVQTGFTILAGVEGQLRQRVPRPLVHPDVALLAVGDLDRQLLAVRREPRIRPVGFRRAEHRRLAVARHPVDRVRGRRGRAGHVHERALRGHGQLRAAGGTRTRGDALERRHRLADRLEAIAIEAHREERALLQVDQMPARHVAAVSSRRGRPPSASRPTAGATTRLAPSKLLPVDECSV